MTAKTSLRGLLLVTLSTLATAQATVHVNGTCGDDSWTGTSPLCVAPDGPKLSIQAGLDAAQDKGTVLVADGVYTGPDNKWLFLPAGIDVTLRSANGPRACIIDLEDAGTAFFFVANETADDVVQGFTVRNGNSSTGGAMFCHHDCRVTFRNCVFERNSTTGAGGVALCDNSSSPTFIDCRFVENFSAGFGGAIAAATDSASITLINCSFSRNVSQLDGGAVYFGGSANSPLVSSCTFTSNAAGGGGGAIYAGSATTLSVTNSILWGNTSDQLAGPGGIGVEFSDVQGGWPGQGNVDLDPLFVAPGSVRLSGTSPCVDLGSNALVLPGITLDGFGGPRVADGDGDLVPVVDMGAFEVGKHPVVFR